MPIDVWLQKQNLKNQRGDAEQQVHKTMLKLFGTMYHYFSMDLKLRTRIYILLALILWSTIRRKGKLA